MKPAAPAFSLPRTLFRLTVFFISAQIIFFLLSVLMSGVLHVLATTTISWQIFTAHAVFFPFLGYLVSQFLLYALFGWIIWYVTTAAAKIFALQAAAEYSLGVMLWIMCAALVIIGNSIYFNQSIFALPSSTWMIAFFWLGVVGAAIFMLLAMTHLVSVFLKQTFTTYDLAAVFTIFSIAAIICLPRLLPSKQIISKASVSQPNIILISVEALRPDYIQTNETMPFLSSLLQTSVQFTDAYTPIAQSFPSWISLLTGKTPLHHGARSFYANFDKINFHDSLLHALRHHGYESVYAVDGQRFGDITTKVGFDQIISPPYGAAELLIGSMSDFPLSNLLLKTRMGKYLFPYNYANRTIAATYHPEDFSELITSSLSNRSGKPLFLSVHFGVSHWPYRWADDQQHDNQRLAEKYRHSLRAADNQIKHFFDFLHHEKLLEHAIIVFISDHGTGLGIPGDSLTNELTYVGNKKALTLLQRLPYSELAGTGINTSYGYSTDILSMQQFRVLLAIKANGFPLTAKKSIAARASLIDIAPTLLELLNIKNELHSDGISLVDAIKHPKNTNLSRELFLENGFTAPEISQAKMATANILQASISTVILDPASGLLYVNDDAARSMLKNKERALLYGDWLLARRSSSKMVLANIKSGQWTTEMNSSLAKQAPLVKMFRDFKQYNNGEI